MGTVPKVVHLEARNEVEHAFSDHTKTRAAFGDLIGGVTLEDGLARMAAWARTIGPQEWARFSGIEVAKNLPPSWR